MERQVVSLLLVLTCIGCGGAGDASKEGAVDPKTDPLVRTALSGETWNVDYNNCTMTPYAQGQSTAKPTLISDGVSDAAVGLEIRFEKDPAIATDLGCKAELRLNPNAYGKGTINGAQARWAEGNLLLNCVGDCKNRCTSVALTSGKVTFSQVDSKLQFLVKVGQNNCWIDLSK